MLATEIKNCLSCPSRQFFDKSIATYEDGILKNRANPIAGIQNGRSRLRCVKAETVFPPNALDAIKV